MYLRVRSQTNKPSYSSMLARVSVIFVGCFLANLLACRVTFAANPPPVQVYYIPVPEDQALSALQTIYPDGNACPQTGAPHVQNPVASYVSISVISDNTILYYDQWEDGFEVDVTHPTQSTTEIWGDGDPSNGHPPGIPTDKIMANTVIVLDNQVDTATRKSVLDYDGGDRISASKSIAVTRAAWASGSSTLLAGALESYPVDKWGTRYVAPAGVNVAYHSVFEYTGLAIMASENGTSVSIDNNGDGIADQTAMLQQGQSYLANGGIQAGAIVTASAPVQVAMITGDICDIYESRWYVLFPADRWSNSYYDPVSTPARDGTTVFVYNPGNNPLTVHWETLGGAQPDINVGVRATSFITVPEDTGAHLFTDNGEPFEAIAAIDSTNPDNFNSYADWGFSLVPESQLTPQTLIGWGPGRDPLYTQPTSENGSPVWVMPVLPQGGSGSVDICVDYKGDNAGSLVDHYGFHYDRLLSLNQFENMKVFDPNGDQTGMILYVCDPNPAQPSGAKLVAAWGQSPADASAAEPGLDLGTTAPPAQSFAAGKSADLLHDADGDGLASPGDTLLYSVVIRNSSRGPIEHVTISDTAPLHTGYVTATTTFDNGASIQPIPDGGATPFPLDERGVDLGLLPVRGVFTVTFQVTVDKAFPAALDRVRNVAIVTALGESTKPEVETHIYLHPSIVINKTTNGADADQPPGPLVRAGNAVLWTYAITNTGVITIANVTVSDNITGVTPIYVSGDSNNDNILDPGETWIYTATETARNRTIRKCGDSDRGRPRGRSSQSQRPEPLFWASVRHHGH